DSGFILNDDRTVIMTGSRYELCGAKMPDFIPYIEEVLDIKINPDDRLKEGSEEEKSFLR
ncbi:MAG: hypothetical protein QF886_18255, partial [Planctomycetota bacterium]|nr:hypothetical protein [Planctomycetota bacterium]